MNRIFYFLMCYFFCLQLCAQVKIEIEGYSDVRAFMFSEELPFWIYTNTNGFLDRETTFGVSAFAKANYTIIPSHKVSFGIGAFARNGVQKSVQRNDLFIEYENTWFGIVLGAESPGIARQGLSTINDNILLTGNSRALPGILLNLSQPITLGKLSIDAEIAHYELNDQREVTGAQVHYKFLELAWEFNEDTRFSAGLRHYVQWAGTNSSGENLDGGFKNLVRVFLGQNAISENLTSESINALGNHIGSYELKYHTRIKNTAIELYHHTLFDDRSGRELNNFPDGVWGIYLKPASHPWFKGFLYEYIQTVSQSGRPTTTTSEFGQQSGGDNYFRNGTYRSGWTYEGTVIGLPFINPVGSEGRPVNNRLYAHHLGGLIKFNKWQINGRLSYIKNLGTYGQPFPSAQKKIVSQLALDYSLEKYGSLNFIAGMDLINNTNYNYALGLGYSYILD